MKGLSLLGSYSKPPQQQQQQKQKEEQEPAPHVKRDPLPEQELEKSPQVLKKVKNTLEPAERVVLPSVASDDEEDQEFKTRSKQKGKDKKDQEEDFNV